VDADIVGLSDAYFGYKPNSIINQFLLDPKKNDLLCKLYGSYIIQYTSVFSLQSNNFNNMSIKMQTRKERTQAFRKQVEQEWYAEYLKFIQPFMNKPEFNWYNLTANLNLNPQYIFDNPHLSWDMDRICTRTDIPIDTIIEKYGHLSEFIWFSIMRRDDVTVQYIESHPEYPWPYSNVLDIKDLTIDFIKKHEAEVYFWHHLIFRKTYTIKEFITTFPDHIHEKTILYYTGLTSEQIMQMNDDIVNTLSRQRESKNIPEMVDKYPDMKWKWTEISLNPSLTVPFIKKYMTKINWKYLTSVIATRIIKNNPKLPWDYEQYTYREDISRAELFEHIMDYCDTFNFGSHPEIRFRDFKNENLIEWNINSVSYNKFTAEKHEFIEQRYREYLATYRIQQHYNLVKTAPVYEMCRKRIALDYDREFGSY
jgi:hypothetical protein